MARTTKLMDAELARLFARFDINRDDHIDVDEFGFLLQALGEDIPQTNVSLHFGVIDANNDGIVDFNEFVDWWLDHNSL